MQRGSPGRQTELWLNWLPGAAAGSLAQLGRWPEGSGLLWSAGRGEGSEGQRAACRCGRRKGENAQR